MNKLTRSNALKIAAVIVLVLALLDMIVFELPDLMRGMDAVNQAANAGQGPPFFMVLLSFVFDILAIPAAYGAWRTQRWGVILVIVISVFNIINNILAALFAPWMTIRIVAGVLVFVYLGVIYLCLRREPKSLAQSV